LCIWAIFLLINAGTSAFRILSKTLSVATVAFVAALAFVSIPIVEGYGALTTFEAVGSVLEYSKDQGCGSTLSPVESNNCEIVLSGLECDVEDIKLDPTISSTNLLSIEIGSEIVVSSYA